MPWNIHFTQKKPQETQDIIKRVLKLRKLPTKSEFIADFVLPAPPKISQIIKSLDVDIDALKKVILTIKASIDNKQPIIIYGDYDVDGVCSVTYIYQAIKLIYNKVIYFIPLRQKHGYGLSSNALKEIKAQYKSDKPLIITVDNGITAKNIINKNQNNFDFLIIDHHQKPSKVPRVPILHNSIVCATALSWLVSCILTKRRFSLDLVSIATVCDQMPLSSPINRALVVHGFKEIKKTKRIGLMALFQVAQISSNVSIDSYLVNFIIGPRLNAAGRLDSAEISLKLLSETNYSKAFKLAQKLDQLNKRRQQITQEAFHLSVDEIGSSKSDIIIISHPKFHEGILGLIAAKLTEKFKRPSLVIQSGKNKAKGSARSVRSVDIIKLLRKHLKLFSNLGGHAGAAGFTMPSNKIESLKQKFKYFKLSNQLNTTDIDIRLHPKQDLNRLWRAINSLEPFGNDFHEPVVALEKLSLVEIKLMGSEKQHLKLKLIRQNGEEVYVIGFNQANRYDLKSKFYNIAGFIRENNYNNIVSLQIQLKDLQAYNDISQAN